MSDTLLREKNQITLPGDVVEAAGLRPSDRIAWRFEGGEIRGRKLVQEEAPIVKPIRTKEGFLMLSPSDAKRVSKQDIARAIRQDRDSR